MKQLKKLTNKTFSFFENNSLLISIFITLILFGLFFPLFYGANDEHCYLRNAWDLPRGGIIHEDYGTSLKGEDFGNGYTTKCMQGVSVFLIPFTSVFGWEGAFLATFFVFLGSIYFFDKILKRLKISPIFTLFFAFYPAFVYYSRTIFTEPYTIFATLLGLYFFLKGKNWKNFYLSGLFFGLAIFIRYTQILVVGVFGLFLLWELIKFWLDKKEINKKYLLNLIAFAAGIFPYLPVILYINNILWGGPFSLGYDFTVSPYERSLTLSVVPFKFIRYFIILNIFYPGMWVLAFFSRIKKKWLFLAASHIIIVLYLTYRLYFWEDRLLDAIFGIRYLLPVIPLLILPYFSFIDRIIEKPKMWLAKLFVLLSILFLITTTISIHYIHQKDFLAPRREILNEMIAYIPDDSFIIGELDDFVYIMEPFNDKYYEDVENIERIEDSKSELIKEKDIYLVKITEPNKTGRPTAEMVKFLEEYKNDLIRIDSEGSCPYIEIYKIQNSKFIILDSIFYDKIQL